jgi:predicted Zn-dependent protease
MKKRQHPSARRDPAGGTGRLPKTNVAGHYEEAMALGRRAIRQQPNFQPALRVFAAACVRAGNLNEARAAIARMRVLNSAFRVSIIKDVIASFSRSEDLAAYEDALRMAGLPD